MATAAGGRNEKLVYKPVPTSYIFILLSEAEMKTSVA